MMTDLTIEALQKYLTLKYQNHDTTGLFMKLVEEIGGVAEALNQLDGRKAKDSQASLEKELVDVLHYTIAIASVKNIDLTTAIIEKDRIASVKYQQAPNLAEFLIQ